MGPMGGPETSVSNHPTPPNNPEHGIILINRRRNMLMYIAIRLRDEQLGVRIPAGGRRLFFSSKYPDLFWGPPSLLFNGYRFLRLSTKRSGNDAEQSMPPTVIAKNEFSYISTPPLHALKACTGTIFFYYKVSY
jgi:hypothetical protein